jgi:hypothetical protein
MPDQDDEAGGGWLETLASGGLPQFLLGPAGKAISRLLAGATDIPAAWLEQKSHAIRDETKGRTKIREALFSAAGKRAAKDTARVAKTIERVLNEAERKQDNVEAIAKEALQDLGDIPPDQKSAGPTEDWLNIYVSFAERASSEFLRSLYAKVLAGEIRKGSSYSFATLHLLSIMDQSLAQDLRHLGSWLVNFDYVPIVGPFKIGEKYSVLTRLSDVGVIHMGSAKHFSTGEHRVFRRRGDIVGFSYLAVIRIKMS